MKLIDGDCEIEVSSIKVVDISENDVVIVTCKIELSCEQAVRLRHDLSKVFPNNKILVLANNCELSIAKDRCMYEPRD